MLLLAVASHAENLLKNPGFETTAGNVPAEWNVFVQPKDDASATLDQRVAKDGSNSVKLTIGSPYLEDPANNWSQNVLEDLRGKRLMLRGFIKTEGVGEAAVWVQCYQRNPLRMILQESTSSNGLLTGTQDWTPVHVTINVPMTTDFVVVRCVLRFRGTAWFDGLSLEVENGDPSGVKKPEVSLRMPDPPSMPELPRVEVPSKPSPAEAAELLEAHEELRKANAALQSSNAAMSKQIEDLRKQIEALKRQINETAQAARELKEQQQAAPVEREQPVQVPPPPLISLDTREPEDAP